jgi:uncharacterized protein YjbI with pentapeptide repeats
VVGDALVRGWAPEVRPFLAIWWPWVLIGISAAAVVWWFWWRLPKQQVERLRFAIRDPKARTDVEDNFRKTIGQVLGGIAVLAGAGFAYLQFQQQQTSAHDLLISNQVAKGFELLGNKDGQIEQRLGGIYALEGVMTTSEQYQQPVLEALCAFIRDRTKNEIGEELPATDVQAALTVIGRRAASIGRLVDLTDARTPKARLVGGDLTGANLTGVDLGDAWLPGIKLFRAVLLNVKLSGSNLSGANLSEAALSHADLTNALLFGANFTRANLAPGAVATGNELRSMITGGGFGDLRGANLTGAFLTGANLTEAILLYGDLRGANLGRRQPEPHLLERRQPERRRPEQRQKSDPGSTEWRVWRRKNEAGSAVEGQAVPQAMTLRGGR